MAPPSSVVSKLKVQLKLAISRLRMVQQKDSALAKQQRRAMAQLLEAGKLESARIRVENIIRSDITTELHEMLELYCELLLARSQLLDPPSLPHSPPSPHGVAALDPALEEAVRSLIYAAPRTSIKELHQARNLLVEKFGKDVALASMEGEGVAERVLSKLRIDTPEKKLVDAYLSEIARFYGVPFGETEAGEEEDEDDDGEGGGGGIGELAEPTQSNKAGKEKQLELPLEAEPGAGDGDEAIRQREEDEVAELAKATPPRKFGPQSPLRITPPSPSTDNIAPKLRLPGQSDAAKVRKGEVKPSAPAKKKDEGPGGKIPDVDELAKRFAQLKR